MEESTKKGPSKRDWAEIVKKATDGTRVMVPESLLPLAKKAEEMRIEFEKEAKKMAKMEILMANEQGEFFVAMRKYLEENGHSGAWVHSIGFEMAALKDGEFVINISEPQQEQ